MLDQSACNLHDKRDIKAIIVLKMLLLHPVLTPVETFNGYSVIFFP